MKGMKQTNPGTTESKLETVHVTSMDSLIKIIMLPLQTALKIDNPRTGLAKHKLKVCLLGDTGVGKSSIVCRFVQDHFDHNISPTIGASFMTKTVPCGNELHKFLIWDTAGQERFHSLAPMYYRGSAAAVIVYDITKQDSFHTLKKWVKELKEHGPENIVMAIAGNKCDLSDIREVPLKDAKEYAESIGAIVVETSAKNAVNIEELFQGISRQIPPLDPHENGNNGAIKLGKQTSQTELATDADLDGVDIVLSNQLSELALSCM
ncbi:ras-related protein Rab-31 isoform B [Patagioenas fasciata monilis]|uniref:Ras-related protein Rab-31 isoform B n=1 Tax=Patagioenas fasciata monilis TaxID=372326 RepID=A0A1V4J922_PATFA|nr:ras-related protein Rab-31 isoform B [Patagioenas fasciata monilis]